MSPIDELKNHFNMVLRYWRTVEHWSAEDLNEARSFLDAAIAQGPEGVEDALMYYRQKALDVRALLVDQTPVSPAIPKPFRATHQSAPVNDPINQLSLFG